MIDPQLWQDLVIFVTELEKNSAGNGERANKHVTDLLSDMFLAVVSTDGDARERFRT